MSSIYSLVLCKIGTSSSLSWRSALGRRARTGNKTGGNISVIQGVKFKDTAM